MKMSVWLICDKWIPVKFKDKVYKSVVTRTEDAEVSIGVSRMDGKISGTVKVDHFLTQSWIDSHISYYIIKSCSS